MYLKSLIFRTFSSKIMSYSCAMFFILFAVSNVSYLEAGGWGKTDEIIECEGTMWNGVYFDMNGFYFTASIPNFSGAVLQNGEVTLNGNVEDKGYIITTSFNPGFKPPKSAKEFLKLVQDANPDCIIAAVNSENLGATKYVVDILPINQENASFWRLISTKDRLVKMGTTDMNEARRLNFFRSIRIR